MYIGFLNNGKKLYELKGLSKNKEKIIFESVESKSKKYVDVTDIFNHSLFKIREINSQKEDSFRLFVRCDIEDIGNWKEYEILGFRDEDIYIDDEKINGIRYINLFDWNKLQMIELSFNKFLDRMDQYFVKEVF